MKNKLNNNGFTLIEVLVAMALFVVVIMITGTAFNNILGQSARLQRSEESNIEGMIGLEMLRHDLQQAGFGLFTEVPPMDYDEATVAPALKYNDSGGTSPNFHVPRPFVTDDNLATVTVGDISDGAYMYNVLNGTDYLAIKATTVGTSKVAQKWSYIVPVAGGMAPKSWLSNAENFTGTDERFVVLKRAFSTVPTVSVEKNTADNRLWFKINSPAFDVYTSKSNAVYTAYGIVGNISDESKVRFPFNRSDYFVARPKDASRVPPVCAPNTGILYKTVLNHADGALTYMPVMDCVADMQIVLGWDINLDGMVDTWSNASGTATIGSGSAADVQAALSQANNDTSSQTTLNIRNCLKVVKVYLIAQNGRKDTNYLSPDEVPIGDRGEKSLIRATGGSDPSQAVFLPSADMKNYRWKEYRIVVRPKNLTSNQ